VPLLPSERNKMKKIQFSIITPTYNRAETGLVEKMIKSIQVQLPGDYEYEHIIIDDGSTDETKGLITKLASEDSHIKYFYQDNQGTPQAVKNAVSKANGDYLIKLDDDDILPPNSLKLRADFIRKNPDIDWFYGKTQWIGDDGKPVKTWKQSLPVPEFPYERMLAENFIQGGTTTIKKEVYQKIKWPSWLRKSDDYFVAMELVRPENHYKFKYLDEVLHNYRRHNLGFGTQSGRSLKDEKSEKKRWELDNRIRRLHPAGIAYLSSELNSAWRELRYLKYRNSELEPAETVYKKELAAKDKLINDILNSKSWKVISFVRKMFGKDE
jgi:glycosyltransferase involved in cell wall biosynthesis